MLLHNKNALITGGAKGIGASIVRLFASHGANVAIHFNKSEDCARSLIAELREHGHNGLLFRADLTDKKQVESLTQDLVKELGSVDILVNNAGIKEDSLMLRMRDHSWRNVIETNLNSVFYCSKSIGKQMVLRRKSGAIVNIASLSGIAGRSSQANYAASKGGVIALTKSMALELARWNIRVNAVVPGMIQTDMTKNLDKKYINSLEIPLGRMGLPSEVAECALFLASECSSYITGTTINVSGGAYT